MKEKCFGGKEIGKRLIILDCSWNNKNIINLLQYCSLLTVKDKFHYALFFKYAHEYVDLKVKLLSLFKRSHLNSNLWPDWKHCWNGYVHVYSPMLLILPSQLL